MSQQVEGWNLRSCNPRYGKDSSLEDELPGLVKSLGSPAYISIYKGHEWKGSHNNRSLGGRKGSRWFWTTYKSCDDPSSPLISEGTLDLCAFFVWVGSSSIRVFLLFSPLSNPTWTNKKSPPYRTRRHEHLLLQGSLECSSTTSCECGAETRPFWMVKGLSSKLTSLTRCSPELMVINGVTVRGPCKMASNKWVFPRGYF